MKELFDRLLKSLGISGRDWAVLLLALLLAFSIWLIHNLSLRYNDFLTVPVVARSNIEGHSDIASNHCNITARCRTTGYHVIRHNMRQARRIRAVDFRPEVMKHQKDDVYYITATDLTEYSHLIFGDDVTVEYFETDTLFFTFPAVDHKKVPVYPSYSVSFREQYTSVGDLKVVPDSVTLYGEMKILENIDRVMTRPLKKTDLYTDIQGILKLEQIPNVRFSDEMVQYSMQVTRYVEIISDVRIEPRGVPLDKEMVVVPSKVKASLKCFFPLKGDPATSMRLYVDYDAVFNTVSGKCPVRSAGLPEGVISYEVEPFYVECIVRDL